MHRPRASHLVLWKKRLGRVPDSVWQRTDLESLVLADNYLSEVSEQIGSLKRLRMLDLGQNQLTRVPDALGGLEGLTDFLYLHDNSLTSLPPSFERLKKLRYLNSSENEFAVLPKPIRRMEGLIELRASDHHLTSIPGSIARLSRLRELHLQRLAVTILGASGGLALLLAGIGLYGVMSYAVSQSTRELGLRMALGADPPHLLRLAMSQGLALTAGGVILGAAASFGMSRLIVGLLYKLSPRDPLAFGAAFAVMTIASLAACFLPAWRATRTDPLQALRNQGKHRPRKGSVNAPAATTSSLAILPSYLTLDRNLLALALH